MTLEPNKSTYLASIYGLVRDQLPLISLLALFALFSLMYSITLPVFEAPDERDHFLYINWLADGNPIPHIFNDLETVGHEVGQPPLYYALLTPIIAPIDRSNLDSFAPINPYWRSGAGKNTHYHTAAERFPYRQSSLAVHLARIASVGMGMITIAATYFLARHFIPKHALWAAALLAFTPQFGFLSGVINNDNLVIMFSSLTLLQLVRVAENEDASIGQYILLGVLWGSAVLSKLSGLALGGIIVFGFAAAAWRNKNWKRGLFGLLLVALGFTAVSGWWFGRNWQLYDHPLAWDALLTANGGLLRTEALSWWQSVRASTYLHRSYWAMFGYGIPAPNVFYWFTNALLLCAVIGIFRNLWQRKLSQHRLLTFLLLAGWVLIMYAALLNWIRQLEATEQGRLIFPAISAISILLVWGLSALPYQQWIKRISVGGLGIWSAILPVWVIVPTFATPAMLPSDRAVPNSQMIAFGTEIELRGYAIEQPAAAPGQALTVELFWQAKSAIAENYTVSVHVLDASGQAVSKLDTIPFNGRFPTPVWPTGQTFRDRYTLPPLAETAVPGLGSIIVKLYPWRQTDSMLPITVNGQDIGTTLQLTPLKIKPPDNVPYEPTYTTDITFGNIAQLIGFDAPDTSVADGQIPITLYWQPTETTPVNYTVFVHLLDEQGELIAQADGMPENGRFPTSIWTPPEIIADKHSLHLPNQLQAGQYTLFVGFYNAADGTRLPAQSAGERIQNDAAPIHTITIQP